MSLIHEELARQRVLDVGRRAAARSAHEPALRHRRRQARRARLLRRAGRR